MIRVLKVYRVSQKFVPLLYKSVFQYDWTWYANQLIKSCVFQSNSLSSYLLCHPLTRIFDLCIVLGRQRCACASIFTSHIILYFITRITGTPPFFFCEYYERYTPLTQKRSATCENVHFYLLAYLL